MFATKSVRVCISAYYEARRLLYEKFRGQIGWVRLTDAIFRLGLAKLKELPENEVLQFLRGGT